MNITEAAQFLFMHPEELRQRTKRGQVPGAKAGRRYVFIDEDLAEYLRSRYAVPRQALRVAPTEKESRTWPYASEKQPGGSTSSPHRAREYEEALRPKTKR
jgi:hypothetical protein